MGSQGTGTVMVGGWAGGVGSEASEGSEEKDCVTGEVVSSCDGRVCDSRSREFMRVDTERGVVGWERSSGRCSDMGRFMC